MKQFLSSVQKGQVPGAFRFRSGAEHTPQPSKKLQLALSASWIVDPCIPSDGALTKDTPIVNRFVQIVLNRAFFSLRLQTRKRRLKNVEIFFQIHEHAHAVENYLPIIFRVS